MWTFQTSMLDQLASHFKLSSLFKVSRYRLKKLLMQHLTVCLVRIRKVCSRHRFKRRRRHQRPITAAKYQPTNPLSLELQIRCFKILSITQIPWKRRAVKQICLRRTDRHLLTATSMWWPSSETGKVRRCSKISTVQLRPIDPWWQRSYSSSQLIPKVWSS